jgi:hypothetical protein
LPRYTAHFEAEEQHALAGVRSIPRNIERERAFAHRRLHTKHNQVRRIPTVRAVLRSGVRMSMLAWNWS